MRFTITIAIFGLIGGALGSPVANDAPNGDSAPVPITASTGNLPLPTGLESWNITSLNMTYPKTFESTTLSVTEAGPAVVLCGANTNPPFDHCSEIMYASPNQTPLPQASSNLWSSYSKSIARMNTAVRIDPGGCVGQTLGACRGTFCNEGARSFSVGTTWIKDQLEAVLGDCVFSQGREGHGFDCYSLKAKCQNWGAHIIRA